MTDGLSAPDTVARAGDPRSLLRLARTLMVVLLVAGAAYVALNRAGGTEIASASSENAAALAVATGELVELTTESGDATKATGGYVPGVGIVITAEVEELASAEIEPWARRLLQEAGPMVTQLGADEEIVFLVDVASPARTTRLIGLSPEESGAMQGREAPATSTAPLRPVFDDADPTASDATEEADE